MGFSKQEYWNDMPYPTQGIFLDQGSNPCPLHFLHWQVDSLPLSHLGNRFQIILSNHYYESFWELQKKKNPDFQKLKITSPGWMRETSAQSWCTGKTQRDQVERQVGGGIGMGNTCKSMADSCQCMAKTTTIL